MRASIKTLMISLRYDGKPIDRKYTKRRDNCLDITYKDFALFVG